MNFDLLPACVACRNTIDPIACSFLSCGDLLCQSCSKLHQEVCPEKDGGKGFQMTSELSHALVTIVNDIRQAAIKCFQKEQILYQLEDELKSVYENKLEENTPIWVCGNCKVNQSGTYCGACESPAPDLKVCSRCQGAIDRNMAICIKCLQLAQRADLGCPVCGEKFKAGEQPLDHITSTHLRVPRSKKSDNIKASYSVNHPIFPDLQFQSGSNLPETLSHELGNLYVFHRDIVEKKCSDVSPFLERLNRVLKGKYADCTLEKYGSGANGFTMAESDFDLTLLMNPILDAYPYQGCYHTLSKSEDLATELQKLAPKLILLSLVQTFKDENFVVDTGPINARTPVIKCKREGLELDISIGNEVAVFNTRMLNTYCNIDERVRTLGMAIKYWAKCRYVADASQGYLSSYSYLILMIAFLQRYRPLLSTGGEDTSPALLPNLQEDYPPSKNRDRVGKWDCSFVSDPEPYRPTALANNVPVARFLLEFFRYYGSEFDWETNCVSIRQSDTLSKAEKVRQVQNWKNAHLAIEDPFEIERNLGDVRN